MPVVVLRIVAASAVPSAVSASIASAVHRVRRIGGSRVQIRLRHDGSRVDLSTVDRCRIAIAVDRASTTLMSCLAGHDRRSRECDRRQGTNKPFHDRSPSTSDKITDPHHAESCVLIHLNLIALHIVRLSGPVCSCCRPPLTKWSEPWPRRDRLYNNNQWTPPVVTWSSCSAHNWRIGVRAFSCTLFKTVRGVSRNFADWPPATCPALRRSVAGTSPDCAAPR